MVSAYCANHARKLAYYGHVEGRLIAKNAYASYVKLARKLLKKLDGHPALTAAVETMTALLVPGEEPTAPKPLKFNARWLLWRELRRLDGVQPRDALATVLGVWLLSFHHPRILPDDVRLTYALAQAVLRMRPLAVATSHYDYETDTVDNRHRPIPGLACGLLGRRIRTELAPFLGNVTAALEAEHRRTAEQAMALREPITLA
jgi:hypothetical protein